MDKERNIKKAVCFFFVIVFLSGCTAVDTLKENYLRVDEFNKFTMREAFNTIKRNYLGVGDIDHDTRQKSELMAYDKIMGTQYKDDYEVLDPTIDDALQMPEALPYIFVHFFPKEGRPDITRTSYLVVINRFYKRIEYSGVFTLPKGDPFYRYHEILRKIQH